MEEHTCNEPLTDGGAVRDRLFQRLAMLQTAQM